MKVTCGIDWSEKHHDIALIDADGQLVARRRVTDDAAGWKSLLELLPLTVIPRPGRSRSRSRPGCCRSFAVNM